MMVLIRELLRPYRGSLAMILVAMLVQSTMTLAAPWPLKIVIDNVVVGRKLDPWLAGLLKPLLTHAHRLHLAVAAGIAVVVIAVLNSAASYLPTSSPGRVDSGWPTTCVCGPTIISSICRCATTIPTSPA